MLLTEKNVRYAASLAHLELTDQEAVQFQSQLASILEYMQKLNQLDTTQVEPMAQVAPPGAPNPSLRPDQPALSLPQEEAVAGSAEHEAGLFKVPNVIERD
ncbi:MAG: Asp-tRNA(Asn)/Glu-tRNA(Gln) amidotransferase subunit GatC [Terriglobia bacterium]